MLLEFSVGNFLSFKTKTTFIEETRSISLKRKITNCSDGLKQDFPKGVFEFLLK